MLKLRFPSEFMLNKYENLKLIYQDLITAA